MKMDDIQGYVTHLEDLNKEMLISLIESYKNLSHIENYYEVDFRLNEWLVIIIEKATNKKIEEVI